MGFYVCYVLTLMFQVALIFHSHIYCVFQDFLFPRNLQRNLRSRRTHPHPSPPVDGGQGPLFPPVRHVSFHSPLPTCPDHSPLTAVDQPNHMPPARPSTVLPLPPAGGLHNLQLAEAPSDTGFKLQATLRSPTR